MLEELPQPNYADSLGFCGVPHDLEGKITHREGGGIFLYGGEDESTHFDITGWSLSADQLHDYGYHRETFKAMIEPKYRPASEVAGAYPGEESVIYLRTESGIKAYPYSLMTYHEVINEVVDGKPIMIAYCFLADLAAVYSREFCGQTFTFGVSGYTYYDPNIWEGKDGFILWDRDTESLWWPLINRGVSGAMNGELLRKHTTSQWGVMSWADLLETHPAARVVISDGEWQAPEAWTRLVCEDLDCCGD